MKELSRLEKLGVLKRQPDSEWASPSFIILKSGNEVRSVSDFREVKKRLVRKPLPIPKIAEVLQNLQGFTYATNIYLIMGYYNIRLDPASQKICTVIFPWGKYLYKRLPMGVARLPDIFQEKMSGLMIGLEFVRFHLDDLLIITRGDWNNHLSKVRKLLVRMIKANLRVNAVKSIFGKHEVEYLGYVLSCSGIAPQKKKIQAILALSLPMSVK